MSQPSLFDGNEPEIIDVLHPRSATPAQRAEAFFQANPIVFELLEELAAKHAARGAHFSTRGLFYILRFEYMRVWQKDMGFKLNDNFSPHTARKLIEKHPEWKGLVETRRCPAELKEPETPELRRTA